MNLDFFKLKSIYLENTVVRNPKVGSKNRPTSRTIDVGCTGVGSMDNIYTGETGINSEYLIQGSVAGNVIKGTAGTFTLNDKKIQDIGDISGLLPGETIKWGDILRADGYNEFYNITGASDDLKTIWLQDNNTTVTGINNFHIRKTKLNSTHFEYIKSDGDDNKFFYDQNNREWRYTGVGGFTGPLVAESNQKLYIEKDPVTFKFYPSNAAVAPDITSVDTTTTDPKSPYGKKILENKLVADTSDIILNPIPYPDDDENFRIYWGPQSSVSLKRKDVDYTINYTMDPDYTSAKLPYKDRTAAYIKFLNELTDTVQVEEIGLDFQGIFNIHEDPSTSATKQPRGVTNIFPNSNGLKVTGDDTEYRGEIIRVGDTVLGKYFDYNIEYDNGIVNFIRHANLELAVPNVLYNRDLIWDGVSVIRGVGLTGLKSQDPDDLVIPYGIAGLTGINVPVYFEDVDENVLKKDQDYVFEYQSGAIKLNTPLKSEECVLVSYFVEGEDVIDEKVNLVTMRTRKYPVIESSVTLKKKYSDKSTTSTGIKILVEGVDFRMLYLSGTIEILNQSIKENLDSLEINYTPFAQLQCILQPVADDPNRYRVTIIDDKLTVVDPFNLKFSVKNPLTSIPQKDPFGEESTTYDNSIAPGSVLSVKGKGEPGYGLGNLTPEQMIDIGITGLHFMGLDKKLGKTTEEFYALGITGVIELGIEQDTTQIYDVTNYKYYDESKELALDASYNADKPKPDLNDLILATYSYVGDVLPYAPVQIIFPVFNKDENSILIEGFDKTDIVYPGMIFRIDNYDPQKYYYFKVNSVVYDGLNTTIYLAGSFVDDIRNPSFYLFDDIINWHPLPEGTSIDSSVTIGVDTFTLTGDTLETKALLRPQALMMVDGIDIYEILSTLVVDSNTIQVKIFPNLQRAYPETILISDPVYQEGTSDIQSKYPIIIDPPHPAFTIRYVKPNSAIYGLATIYIDGEKIVITEVIDDASSIFNYYIKDYNSLRDLVDAIKNTVSTLGSTHNPFSLMSEDGVVEQYYVGSGFWSANLVLPFEQDAPIIIPNEGYTITIKQEVFRYILVKAYKDTFNFLIEQKNRLDYFSSGNLLAFRSKATGNLSFFEISNVDLINESVSGSDPIVHTRVTLKDAFRENMIAPYMYKYDSVNWVEIVTPSVDINHDKSKISFYTDLTILKIGSVIKVNNSFIYQIKDISVNGTIITLTVSPSIKDSLNQITSLYVSDMPIYIDAVSPQPSIFINYIIHEGYSGEAYVEIDDKNIKITEKIIGFSEYSAEISLTHYDNLNQLADALNRLQLTIPGYNPLFVDTTVYKDLFIAGGRSLKLVPTAQKAYLSTSILVSKSIFKINYTSPDSSTDYKVVIPSDGSQRIELSEWKRSDKPGTLRVNYVSYQNRTIIDVINSILNLDSIVSGKPWSVGNINYDVYYATNKVGYYSIIPSPGEEGDSLPYYVQATETPQYWYPVGILNRNVLIEDTDYSIEGTQVILTNPIKVSERYELSYLGIDDLAEYEGENIKCSCRYFYSIPAGYQICAYMDYLNPDQYYIQKLTERRFLEIVTLPQIKDILQQSGGSVGMGNDSGSDNSANNWDGGLVDLYYYLKDEQIKSQIYLRLFSWYKHRLRNFSAEAQVIMGIKYGHCNYVGIKNDGRFTLEDAYVEDNNYTLTRLSDIDQIKNGFSKFFPIGYEDSAPKPYDRFKDQYQSYNEVFCYNIQYIGEDNKPIKKEGRILSSNPYWADVLDSSTIFMDNGVTGIFSCLDFDILPYNQESAFIDGGITGLLYNIPYNQEDKHLRVTDKNFKFLKRVSVGDELQIQDSQNSYKIASIENRNLSQSPVIIRYSDVSTGTPLTYDGTPENPGKLPVYGIYLESYDYVLGTETSNPSEYPVGTPVIKVAGETGTIIGLGYKVANPDISYDRFVLEDGKYFLDSGIRTFDVKKSGSDWKYVTKKVNWTLQDLEDNLPKEGLNVLIKRNENNDFPVIFPAWDDEFNLGTKVTGLRIINQKTNTDIIKKPFSFSELLGLDDEDKYFTVYIGSYDELTGVYKINSTTQVNLKYLTFFEERRVSRILESLKYNITGNTYKLPFPPFILKVANTYKKKDNLGFDKFFYLDFDKYYEASAKNGYNESIIFRSRDRNSWVQYGVDQDNDFIAIAPEYGFSEDNVYNNFYDPNNLYLKLLVERQSWLTELNIIKDIFDTNNKLNRAFTYDVNGLIEDEAEFHDYLNQISCVTGRSLSIKERIELYSENLRFLLDESDTTHKYLIENASGPLYRTMMEYEDDINADTPINTSYKQAAMAKQKYEIFQWECNFYGNLNSFYYSKWSSEYAKWVLSLEKGVIFQKDAKASYDKTVDSYINIGLKTFPAIKISVIDQGTTPPFIISGAKYVVAYNMLATAANEQEEYDDAVLYIEYKISNVVEIQNKSFILKNYPTLQNLIDAINNTCKHPVSGIQALSSVCVFEFYPYRDYSTKWILRTYRSTINNDSNGSDIITNANGWTNLSTNPAIDDQIYVSNVIDHRNYDSRILFMNRIDIHSDKITIDKENIISFPHYVANTGKEILGEIGPIPVSGRWAKDAGSSTEAVDYTREFNVLDVRPGVDNAIIVYYEFLDYVRGEEQIPGKETPRNPIYEKSPEQLMAMGYNPETQILSEDEPPTQIELGAELVLDAKFKELQSLSENINKGKGPQTSVIRDLRIVLRIRNQENPENYQDVSFVFDLRQYPTINDLNKSLNTNRYYADSSGNIILDDRGNAKIAPIGEGAVYFNSELIGLEDLQGVMKTVDIATVYTQQLIHVATHKYWSIHPVGEYNINSGKIIVNTNAKEIPEPIDEYYSVGWQLKEQSVINGKQIIFRIDPRSYSPSYNFRFKPYDPKNARIATFLSEKIDILAFDIYSWDTNASYKIKDNILYLRSDLLSVVQIPLYKTTNLDNSIYHPEEKLKLIDVIRLINNNGVCNKKFFANLRFGREYSYDFEYTYFPDTAIWAGGDGWVPIEKVVRDSMYLSKDIAFSLNSEGANATYEVVPPLPLFPDENTIYTSTSLILRADTIAFDIALNTTDYDIISAEYIVDQTAETMTLTGSYRTFTDVSQDFSFSSYATMQDLVDAINAYLDPNQVFSASLYSPSMATVPTTKLINGTNSSLSSTRRLIASDTGLLQDSYPVINITPNNPEYEGIDYYVDIGLNKITLNYRHIVINPASYIVDFNVDTTLFQVVSSINSYEPVSGNPFFNATVKWINPEDLSSSLLDTPVTSIPFSGVSVFMQGELEYSLLIGSNSITIEDLVNDINAQTSFTGFSVVGLDLPAYKGYKGLPANLLVPKAESSFSEPLYFDFRNIIGAYILNMSHTTRSLTSQMAPAGEPATCTISNGIISFEKVTGASSYFIGNAYSYNIIDKDIGKLFRDSMDIEGYLEKQSSEYPKLSYATGILKMDVALLPIEGITYGKLRLRSKSETDPTLVSEVSSIDLVVNDPEVLNVHVYFGFLGDIRFYQISDYNLWKQYILIKRRLGLPWNKVNDAFIPDYYVPNDKYNFSSYEYTLNLVKNGKFLSYLKYQRFGELADSLRFEDLYNNKYLWLYLKFHKELGCDQKVKAITKKIAEDDQKAKLLM